MITEKHIKPIPKNILKIIEKTDKEQYKEQDGKVRFYKYFTKYHNELCEVTVAVKNRYKKWYCKQVIVHGIHSDKCYLQDIGRVMSFYKVGWYREGFSKLSTWYDYDWGWQYDRYFNLNETVVNLDYVLSLPEYKYSAIDKYEYYDYLNYLRVYEKNPQIELLVKSGLSRFCTSTMILKKCIKDKNFAKWLLKNKEDALASGYTSSIIKAYSKNKPIKEIYTFDKFKKSFDRSDNFKRLKEIFKGKEQIKFLEYLMKQNIDGYSYQDYINACIYLNLDINEEKHRYPHNFRKWHDIRIDQYRTAKAIKDKEERKKLYENFANVSNKYNSLQRNLKDKYICLIAKSPADLINEGESLHHCVGKMNYDQKFAREESLIFFVRTKENPQNSFVTLEYSINKKKVLQCYGEHDSKPIDEVLSFVNNVWLPYANRKMRAIA